LLGGGVSVIHLVSLNQVEPLLDSPSLSFVNDMNVPYVPLPACSRRRLGLGFRLQNSPALLEPAEKFLAVVPCAWHTLASIGSGIYTLRLSVKFIMEC